MSAAFAPLTSHTLYRTPRRPDVSALNPQLTHCASSSGTPICLAIEGIVSVTAWFETAYHQPAPSSTHPEEIRQQHDSGRHDDAEFRWSRASIVLALFHLCR